MSATGQPPAPSFTTLNHWAGRKAWPNHRLTAWALDHKDTGYAFAQDLGFDIPRLSIRPQPSADVPLDPGTVVKPLTSVMSIGVFLVHADHVTDLAARESIDAAETRLRMQELIASGQVASDLWIVERLVMSDHAPDEPARDLKFYCFYGQIPLMLETTRHPIVQRCWYDAGGERVQTGKYTDQLFTGHGIPETYVDAALRISTEVPAPFVRVDFLASPDGPVFNEITPKPGGSHLLNRKWDVRLGNKFLGAERRLIEDLITGRRFDAFLRHAS